jgi:outer membrane protein TolC
MAYRILLIFLALGRLSGAQAPQPAPLNITLAEALRRATAYGLQYLTEGINADLAHEARRQAAAAMLPSLNLLNQYIYTQGNGTPSGVFVANDGVHVYNEQAVIHADVYSAALRAEHDRAIAAEEAARARQGIAERGLVDTIVQNYYAVVIAGRRVANARRSLDEAAHFVDITEKQERGGEAAHADVVKAQLQRRQRERDLTDAEANLRRARIALAVLLFSDLAQPFNIVDDLRPDLALPSEEEIRRLAIAASPDLKAAQAALRAAGHGIRAARGALYPSLSLDYFYGLDANAIAIRGPEGARQLGSVLQGTLSVPVWNWGASRSRVHEAELQQQQARIDLTFTERQLDADIRSLHLEAQTAQAQLASLRDSVDLAGESLRLTVLRYEGGEATALEVADAQTTLAQARNAYDDGLARYRVAAAELQALTGRLRP